jgi:hypothetical protein
MTTMPPDMAMPLQHQLGRRSKTKSCNGSGERRVLQPAGISELRARGGVVTGALADTRMLPLHHVGARSGNERVTPLVWWPAGETAVAILASNFGTPAEPGVVSQPAGEPDDRRDPRRDLEGSRPRRCAERAAATLGSHHGRHSVSRRRCTQYPARDPRLVLELLDRVDASVEAKGESSSCEIRARG